jgi:hypothetical protein
MKFGRASLVAAFALSGILTAATVNAQSVTTTEKTTTYQGTVTEVNPSSSTLILRSESSTAPQTYTYNKETVFADENGRIVSYDAIKDSPVTVQYTRDGDRMIVTKVTKMPSTRRETTTTTRTVE